MTELEFIGKEAAAKIFLLAYWEEKEMTVLKQILECARFPDPMEE